MKKIILASASPRRRDILLAEGIEFTVSCADIDETMDSGVGPRLAVQQIALKKAVAAAGKNTNEECGEAYIIAADTVVCINEEILGKPQSREQAYDFLSRLRGREHKVLTGVCVIEVPGGRAATFCAETKVFFEDVSDAQIWEYIDSGEPMDKAGGYGIHGKGAFLVKKIEGDFNNVVGLPFDELVRFTEKEFGFCLKK